MNPPPQIGQPQTHNRMAAFVHALMRSARWRFWWTLGLIVMLPLTEGAGLALLLPTLQTAGLDLHNQGQADRLARLIWRGFAAVGAHPGFLALLVIYVMVIGLRTILERNRSVSVWTIQQNFEDDLRRRLYRAIAGADWLFITRSRLADFTHALTAEISRVGECVSAWTMIAGDVMLGAIYLAVALVLSLATTLMVLAAGALLAIAMRGKTRRIEGHGAELARVTNLLYAATDEHLQSLKTALTYGANDRNYAIFADLSRRIAATNVDTAREQVAAGGWFEIGAALILVPLLYVSVRVIKVPPAELLLLLLMYLRLMPRIQSIHLYYRNFVNALPSFHNVIALEARCLAAAETPPAAIAPPIFRNEIRLEDLSFKFNSTTAPALRAVNFAIPAGRITAIVGPSGAGKSTVADLVMGLFPPDAGRITIDGAPLVPATARAWRERIGYVANETALFHLTVRENLLWARPGASDTELLDALRLAAADEFVRALPNGIDTVVGERGAMLSQGERQRIALARALLRRPALLILDEATNSLDYDNEARVLGAIEALRGEVTVLMIAHRLSAIRWADIIYVLEDGAVVESGRWNELNARRDGRFRALCEAHRLVA
jgi:ATP-binding cassette, subfamily C, bacterial